ncbi:hypothetical protein Slin15195_G002760 [Septoria linicola]|uniref:SnoaL-like domain-containing protein n=1 Tax=Septoria linicola TaxID=215465 RepID=A0A9Q9ADK1_9PEZI|nr:hypothetical protein Slin15195_G002760 [Septoria linicola]
MGSIGLANDGKGDEWVAAEFIWRGTFAHDLRSWHAGPVAVKATGQTFEIPIYTLFRFDEQAEVSRIDEYYTKNWYDGLPESKYRILAS